MWWENCDSILLIRESSPSSKGCSLDESISESKARHFLNKRDPPCSSIGELAVELVERRDDEELFLGRVGCLPHCEVLLVDEDADEIQEEELPCGRRRDE